METKVQIPKKLSKLFESKARYRVAYGGRGSAKSWSIAQMLVVRAIEGKSRILCARELQKSIRDSSLRLIGDTIERMGVGGEFDVGETYVRHKVNGSEFIFKGLKHNADEIKSTEGIDIVWVEEAHRISKRSMNLLVPTIRKKGSELWFSFNPEDEDDEVYQRFVINKPPKDSFVVKIDWNDNPWFTGELEAERLYDLENDPDGYAHTWEGELQKALEGAYYAKQLADLRDQGFITEIPYNDSFPVDTYWDIGRSDYTGVWFVQKIGMRYHLIDYFQENGEDPPFYAKMLRDKRYWYRTHYLPHDAKHLRMGMGGKTVQEQLEELVDVEVLTLPPSKGLQPEIMAVRAFMKRCAFDEVKCEEGLKSMKNYTQKWNDAKNKFEDRPFHNWASHGADAFRYFAIHCADDMDISEEHDYYSIKNEPRQRFSVEAHDSAFEVEYI